MRPLIKQFIECLKLLIGHLSIFCAFRETPEHEKRFIAWERCPKAETIPLPALTSTQPHIEPTDRARIDAINAEQARELQRYIDSRKSAHYEPPERHTEPHRFHAIHLQRIQTEEMRVVFPVADTDKWLVK